MKKITFIALAVLVSIAGFAQLQTIKMPLHLQTTDLNKSEWIGNTAATGLSVVDPGYEYAIRFSASELTAADEITSVKFYSDHTNYPGYGLTNTSYTIKIYEGGSFDEVNEYDVITACGTPVYTQNYTATTSGIQTVALSTPYLIGTGEFWVSILCNGTSGVFTGNADPTTANNYVMTYNNAGTDIWVNNSFCVDAGCTSTVYKAFCLSVYVEDGTAYIENSDLSPFFIDNETDQNAITSLTIADTDGLSILPVIVNAGPDNADQEISISISINGVAGTPEIFDPATQTTDGYIAAPGGIMLPMDLMSADEMNTAGLTTFDVCITLTYAGIDNVTTNNSACLAITRGVVIPSNSDIEALLMTSNANPTPIASTLTITATDNITVYPGLRNNGPENANTTATIAYTINGIEINSASISLTGLINGAISPLTTSGQLITAANMNTMGLTGAFDVCMSVIYDGTDNVATNNETCVTVTRNPVNVETNFASAISIYPNPANNVVNVANAENANIVIVNVIGEVVATVNNASSNQTINISNLANGTYFVRVNAEVFKFNVVK